MKSSDNQPKKSKNSKEVDTQPAPEQPTQETQPEQKEIRLVDIPINDENTALNVMVGFLNLAHKRGAFTIDESAKIWECILKFQKPN
jgi:glutathione synthase/RimK-type ligase-like ATP-grasp enzyme